MKIIDCGSRFLPLLCLKLGVVPTAGTQCIACVESGKVIAGALYDMYNTVSIHAHIWIEDGKIPSKEWYYAIFDYPFNELSLHKIVGQVQASNVEARKMDEHFGFELEATIKQFSPEGDLLIYTMTKEQCYILNSPKWAPVKLKLVEAA